MQPSTIPNDVKNADVRPRVMTFLVTNAMSAPGVTVSTAAMVINTNICEFIRSLVPQRRHRVHFRCFSRRQIAGEECDRRKKYRKRQEGYGIRRAHVIKKRRQRACCQKRPHK